MNIKNNIISFFIVIFMILFSIMVSGCNNYPENGFDNVYSREATDYFSSRIGFGRGKTDDETLALQYIYSNDDLNDLYGSDFEIYDFYGNGELQSILWIFSGSSEYFFKIKDDYWSIKLEKGYFSKWKVVSYERANMDYD